MKRTCRGFGERIGTCTNPPREPRFGERLRGWLRELPDQGPGQAEGALITLEGRQIAALADAIDRDAGELADEGSRQVGRLKGMWCAEVRQRIEQLVEELRRSIAYPDTSRGRGAGGQQVCGEDVVPAETFLARLGEIFGGSPAEAPQVSQVARFLRDVQELDPASPDAEDSIIVSVGDLEIIAERYIGDRS